MKYLFSFFILFNCVCCTNTAPHKKQDYSFTAQEKILINKIEEHDRVEDQFIGEGGEPSEQWLRFDSLRTLLTEEQLILLTENESPVVRCYAFDALMESNSKQTISILLKHANDTTSVYAQSGCKAYSVSVADYFISSISTTIDGKEVYKKTPEEKAIVDSLWNIHPSKN